MQMGPTSCLHLSALAFLAASFIISGTEAMYCPQGWLKFQGNCYGLINVQQSWKDAENDCQHYTKNSHLASVLSETEGDIIASHIDSNYNNEENIWIGLYDASGSQRWRWLDSSTVHYLPWTAGHPRTMGKTTCGQLSFKADYRQWINALCNEKAKYLCMFRMF